MLFQHFIFKFCLLEVCDVEVIYMSFGLCPSRPAGDLAISGLGWVTVGVVRKDEEAEEEHRPNQRTRNLRHIVKLKVYTPKAVEIFMRPSIPVGAYANEWYEYLEVDEDEIEASRPSIVY